MALTESRLRQIVREEARKVMREGPYNRDSDRDRWTMWDRKPDRHDPWNEYPKGGDDEGWEGEEHDDEDFEGDDY